ncbi:MAG: restriction endonuclease subunit [Flavipsychrobacter sp.]|nr:restriction endonuclease subunit [Flavipsychrobacter sp.]
MITVDFSNCVLRLRKQQDKTTVFDPVRKKWLILTPEEHVRQYILAYLINVLNYPAALIAVEKNIKVGNMNKRFDIVVYNRNHTPWMLVECKAPEIVISEATLQQLLNYQRTVQCSYWLLTNGHQVFCADACNVQDIKWLLSLPAYES